ncbi:MAG: bacterial transcriptional activator domain-containing protein, partial [Chloroflexota bacterium]
PTLELLPTMIGILPLIFMPTHFEEWILAFGEKLAYRCRRRLFEIAELAETQQEYASAIQAYQKLLEEDSTQEAVYRRVMRLQAHLGNRSTALQTYQACLVELRNQLGVLPGEETRRLHMRILQEDPISSPRLAVIPSEVAAQSQMRRQSAKSGRFKRRPIASHISFHAAQRQSASRI